MALHTSYLVLDRIVPLSVKAMGMQIHRCQLLIGDFDLGGIEVGVEVCLVLATPFELSSPQ